MGPYEHLIHTFNFMAPAWGIALFCAIAARVGAPRWLPLAPWSLFTQTLFSGVLGTAVLVGGVLVWDVDGKMATYCALIITCATAQWLMCKGWQR